MLSWTPCKSAALPRNRRLFKCMQWKAQMFDSGVSEWQLLALAVPAAGLRALSEKSVGLPKSCALNVCRVVCEQLRHACR